MTKLITYSSPSDFLTFNKDRLERDYFQHYHLNILFTELLIDGGILYDAYNIIGSGETDVMAVWYEELYFIYADAWNDKAVKILNKKINLKDNEIKSLRGQKNLIQRVI